MISFLFFSFHYKYLGSVIFATTDSSNSRCSWPFTLFLDDGSGTPVQDENAPGSDGDEDMRSEPRHSEVSPSPSCPKSLESYTCSCQLMWAARFVI